MELKSLMSGIAVVIDDKLRNSTTKKGPNGDLIFKIAERLEQEWNLPFYSANEMPRKKLGPTCYRPPVSSC